MNDSSLHEDTTTQPALHEPTPEQRCAAYVLRSGTLAALHTEGVTADQFQEPVPAAVVAAAEELREREGESISANTVQHRLQQTGAWERMGGEEQFSVLRRVGAVEDDQITTYVRDVRAAAQVRKAGDTAGEIASIADSPRDPRQAEEDISDLTDELLRQQSGLETDVYRGADIAEGMMDLIFSEEPANLTVATGFPRYDDQFRGLIDKRLNIVAARTDHGKTAFADQIGINVAKRYRKRGEEKCVLVFDLENGPEAKQMRYNSNLSGVPISGLQKHADGKEELPDPQLRKAYEATEQVEGLPLVLDTTAGADTTYIQGRVMAERARREVGLVIVDYLTQMGEPGDGPMEKTMHAVKGLHDLAKSLGVCVLGISQISRDPVTRSDPEPKLHDMAWSDDVAQKPAQVTTLHHYLAHWDQTSRAKGERPDPERLGIFVRKNKGPKGPLELRFDKECLRIYDESDRAPF